MARPELIKTGFILWDNEMNTPHRRKEWTEFRDWCQERRLKPFPAHPWTVAAYMRWLDANRRYRTLQKRLDVIARVHLRQCIRSPDVEDIVQRTIKAIESNRERLDTRSAGEQLLKPSRQNVTPVSKKTRSLSNTPPLVSRRPDNIEEHP